MRSLFPCVLALWLGYGAAFAETMPSWPAGRPVADVETVAVLEALEEAGFGLGALLGGPSWRTTRELGRNSAVMRTLAAQLAQDVAVLRAEMVAGGRAFDESRPGEVAGAFDAAWLDSPIARFELAGLVNRLDRQDFSAAEGKATCGEIRLIYRLAYRTESRRAGLAASRLPFTLNAVFDVPKAPGGDCLEAALAWVPREALAAAEAQAKFLAAGPLGRGAVLRQVEVNFQAVRVPSGMEPSFGGQAAYLMRVFGIEGEGVASRAVLRPLENTPDIARLQADPALRGDLVAYLREHSGAIDQGVFVLPERFNATKAIAYSTYGSARLGNRPFTELLSPRDFDGLDLAATRFARSPEALIERLDNSSCQGCHQAGATAGFHWLGLDRGETSSHNRLAQGGSPHLAAERARRNAYLEAMVAGRSPALFRPVSSAPAANWTEAGPAFEPAGAGMACIPERSRPLVGADWTCAAGTSCDVIAENDRLGFGYGQCMPKREISGLACWAGKVGTGKAPHADTLTLTQRINSRAPRASATAYNCRPPKIGVPGGLAYRQCSPADRAFDGFVGTSEDTLPAEICGLAGGKGFDRCIASKDVAGCLHGAVARGNRPTCSRTRGCREDYICQAVPDEIDPDGRVPADVGFCSPTYFVLQMRLDGHPEPAGTRPGG